MQGNIIGQSGMFVNDSLFPIYQQLNQPIEYNGIWIKTEDNLKDVYFQTDEVREAEKINDLPYYFSSGRATSVGSNIYLFGGADNDDDDNYKAYKYNSIEKTYTRLQDVPYFGLTNEIVVSNETEIYLGCSKDRLYSYDINTDTYTFIESFNYISFAGCIAVLIGDDLYTFGSSDSDYEYKAYKNNIQTGIQTKLSDINASVTYASAAAVSENEICIFNLIWSGEMRYYLYKYNITEDKYYKDAHMLGETETYNTKINNYVYLGGVSLAKYSIKNNSFYSYNRLGNQQLVHVNKDLYRLVYNELYKEKIIADYKGDGIYIISQESSLDKNLDINNILDVKKIVDEEEQDILVYVGDGESWKLLNSSDTTQTTNALQYALSFKEEN